MKKVTMLESFSHSLPLYYPNWYPLFEYLVHYSIWVYIVGTGIIIIMLILEIPRHIKNIKNFTWKPEYSLLFGVLFLCLICAEIFLRSQGFKPGQTTLSPWLTKVDSLLLKKGFYADSTGIFNIDSEAGKEISKRIKLNLEIKDSNRLIKVQEDEANEVYDLVRQFCEVQSATIENDFTDKIGSLKSTSPLEWTSLDSAIWKYSLSPINQDGFKSVAFKKYPEAKTSVLLLGDSFTWGHSTTNITNSFSDLLLSNDIAVYNTGISGTDASQYLKLAKLYIPILEPDMVIVNFYLGNDV
jgi:hypothetical protein